MLDYLTRYASVALWGRPFQDEHYIIEPYRITPAPGVFNQARVMERSIFLPKQNKKFHVFQIGQMHPGLLRMCFVKRIWEHQKWVPIPAIMNRQFLMMDIYTLGGIQLPRCQAYVMFTDTRDLIIAIEDNPAIPIKYGTDRISLRIYENSYFETIAADQTSDKGLFTHGIASATVNEILSIQDAVGLLPAKNTRCFVNGYQVSSINLITAKAGDTVEYVYDSTIQQAINIPIASMPVFLSARDDKNKYLVHPLGDDGLMHYSDDIDCYISYGGKGVYYHRNAEDNIRHVTHRDYSVPTSYAQFIGNTLKAVEGNEETDVQDYTLTLYIRKSAQEKPIAPEDNRWMDLYALDESQIVDALTGTFGSPELWRAEVMENSASARLLSIPQISNADVPNSLGYNATAWLLANTPQKPGTAGGVKIVSLPFLLQSNATAYEYVDGVLKRSRYISLANVYLPSADATLVEILPGKGTQEPVQGTNTGTTVLSDPHASVYILLEGVLAEITGNSQYYSLNGTTLTPTQSYTDSVFYYRGSKTFLDYTVTVEAVDGVVMHTLQEYQHGQWVPLATSLGNLDLFLNGNSLIESIDYYRRGDNIYITCKEYWGDINELRVRYFNGNRSSYEDSGFINHGTVSSNSRYNIRNGRVLRTVVGGKLTHPNDLIYAENSISAGTGHLLNGQPYSVRDYDIPLHQFMTVTKDWAAGAKVKDKAIGDYLTRLVAEPAKPGPNVIRKMHTVFSPFVSAILDDLADGTLAPTGNNYHFDTKKWCKAYDYLLTVDPARQGVDTRYVEIRPSISDAVISLGFSNYTFFRQVLKDYDLTINSTPYVRLSRDVP